MSWTVDDLLAALPEPEAYAIADGATLRASWAGSCERVISYRARGVEPTDWLPLEIRFAYAVGHAVHEVVQSGLKALFPEGEAEKAGSYPLSSVWSTDELPVPPDVTVGFHADFWRPGGVVTPDLWRPGVVTEIKSMQTFPHRKARTEGVQEWHLAQAGIAAIGLDAQRVEIVYVDKAKGDVDLYEFDPPVWQPAAQRALLSMLRGLALATRIEPNRQHWRCRNCEFYTRCGEDG